MRILRRVPEREALAAGIVLGQRSARLHRVRHQPVVDELELGDMLGCLECGGSGVMVAQVPVVDRVVGGDLVDQRRAFGGGLGGIDHRRQHLVIDDNLLGRVLGLRERVRDDDGNRITHMAGLADRKRRMRRHLHGRAVLRQHGPAADQVAKLAFGKFRAGRHAHHAGHAGRRLGVDAPDLGVRMRGANEIDMGLRRTGHVVGVLALAGDETEIFLAAHRSADSGCTHSASSRSGGPSRRPLYSAACCDAPLPMALAPAAMAFTMLW